MSARPLLGSLFVMLLLAGLIDAAERPRPVNAAPGNAAPVADAPPDMARLWLREAAVQKALRLSPQTTTSITAIVSSVNRKYLEEWAERVRANGGKGYQAHAMAADPTRSERERVETARQLQSVKLTEPQSRRLAQIDLQQQGLAAFLDPKHAETLQLTDENRAALAAKQAELDKQPKHEQIKAALTLLSEEQQQAWQKLAGALVVLDKEQAATAPAKKPAAGKR